MDEFEQCSVEDCNKPKFCKGYCTKHYQRNLKHGSPDIILLGQPRIWIHKYLLEPESDQCSPEWPFGHNAGYAWISGPKQPAHKYVCELVYGPAPDETFLACHKAGINCRRDCINPRHLRWDTPTANMLDKNLDGTQWHGGRGQKNFKLRELDIKYIFGLKAMGHTNQLYC